MKKINLKSAAIIVASMVCSALSLNSCNKKTKSEVTEITIACVQNDASYDFINEDGELEGVEPDIIREIDRRLDSYKINLVPSSYDDVTIGVQTGKYTAGTGTYFLTKERLVKYKIPDEPIVKLLTGMVVRKQYSDGIFSIEDLAEKQRKTGFKIAPMTAGEGNTFIYEAYNEKHPELPLKFEYTSENMANEIVGYVALGRYDAAICTESRYNLLFTSDEAAYHKYIDQVAYVPTVNVGAYTLFYKNADQAFVDAYTSALHEMKEDGTASKIAIKYLGKDVYNIDIHNLTE